MAWTYATGVLTSTGGTEASPDSLLAGIAIVQPADATRGWRDGLLAWLNNVEVRAAGSFIRIDPDSQIDLRGSSFINPGNGGVMHDYRSTLIISTSTSRIDSAADFETGSTLLARRLRPNDPSPRIIYNTSTRHDYPTILTNQTPTKVVIDGLDLYGLGGGGSSLKFHFGRATTSSASNVRLFANANAGMFSTTYNDLHQEAISVISEQTVSTITLNRPVYYRATPITYTGNIRRGQFNIFNPTFLNNCWNGGMGLTETQNESRLSIFYTYTNTIRQGLTALQGVNLRFTRARQSVTGSPTWTAPDATITATTNAQGTYTAANLLDTYREGTSTTDVERFNWTMKARAYDRRTAGETVFSSRVFFQHSVNMAAGYSEEIQMLSVSSLSLTQAQAAALTGISFAASGTTGGTVTVTEARTDSELWAAYRNWISQTANFDSEDTWTFDGTTLNQGAWNMVNNSTFTGSIKTTGTVTGTGTVNGAVEDSVGVRVTVRKAGGGNFNIVARYGTTGAYTDLGFTENTASITYTVPKGQPVEVAMWSLGCVTYTRIISTVDGGVVWDAEMTVNTNIDTTLDVSAYLAQLSLGVSGGDFAVTFDAPMVVAGIELGKALVHRLVSSELALRSALPPASTTIVTINPDEITLNRPDIVFLLDAGVPTAGRVYLDFFINQTAALATDPTYIINPPRADNNQVQMLRAKPALDASVLATAVWQAGTRTLTSGGGGGGGATLAEIEGSTVLAKQAAVLAVGQAVAALPAPPTSEATATAVRTELATELGRIDAAVSTRLAASGYTAPANADIAAIKAKTDTLQNTDVSGLPTLTQIEASTVLARQATVLAVGQAVVALPVPPTAAANAAATATAVRTELATELARVDAPISSRSTLTAQDIPAGLSAADVWSNPSRTLTQTTGLTPAQAEQLRKVAQLHGVGTPLVVTETARTAGDVAQTITTDEDGKTTVSAA